MKKTRHRYTPERLNTCTIFVSVKTKSCDGVLSKMCLCSSLFVDQFVLYSKRLISTFALLYESYLCSKEDDVGQTYIKDAFWKLSINILRDILRNLSRYPRICPVSRWFKSVETNNLKSLNPGEDLARSSSNNEGMVTLGDFEFDKQA